MPEIRYETIETYDNKGNLIGTEQNSREVSDEELAREKAEAVVLELSALPDAELTTARLRRLIKALARLRR